MGETKMILFSKITVDEEFVQNSRSDWNKHNKSLQENIYNKGLLNPLTVARKDDAYVLVAGFRRYAAIASMAKFADFDEKFGKIACTIVEGDQQLLQQYNLIENLQREDLTPAETANGMAKLKEMGLSQQKIGAAVGKTQAYVSMLLNVHDNLCEEGWSRFSKGELGVTEAKEMASLDKEEQEKRMGVFKEAMDAVEDDEEVTDGDAKKGKISKAKKEAKKKVRDAVLPGERLKWAITTKKAKSMLDAINHPEHGGINPNHSKDSYVDGVVDTLEACLGIKEFPFQTMEPAKPKAKPGRPKKTGSADDIEIADEDLDDLVMDDDGIEDEIDEDDVE